jgi:hypothetical protein
MVLVIRLFLVTAMLFSRFSEIPSHPISCHFFPEILADSNLFDYLPSRLLDSFPKYHSIQVDVVFELDDVFLRLPLISTLAFLK